MPEATATLSRLLGGSAVLGLISASAQLFGSRMVGQVAGFAALVLAARQLGPDEFGLYTFAVTAALLVAQVPGTGVDLSAVRLSAAAWRDDPGAARGILLLAALGKAGVGTVLATAGLLLAQHLASDLLGRPELELSLRFAVVAAVALGTTESMLAVLQSRERFADMFAVNVGAAALKVLPVLALVALGQLTTSRALVAFVAAAALGCLLSMSVALPAWRGQVRVDRVVVARLLALSPWLASATLLAAIATNLDILVLASVAGPAPAGMYSAGRTLALPFGVVATAVGGVLLPKMARLADDRAARRYARHICWRLAVSGALLGSALIVASPLLIGVLYGAAYADAIAVFRILVVAHLLDLVAWPAIDLLLVADRPMVVAGLNAVFLIVAATGLFVLVPLVGPAGAAWAILASRALILALYLVMLWTSDFTTTAAARIRARTVG